MKNEGSLQHSQQPATYPYSEPDQTSRYTPSHFLKIHFNIILNLANKILSCSGGSFMLHGQTSYAGTVTVPGVKKIRRGELHQPLYPVSSKYVLEIISACAFRSLYRMEFRVFL